MVKAGTEEEGLSGRIIIVMVTTLEEIKGSLKGHGQKAAFL